MISGFSYRLHTISAVIGNIGLGAGEAKTSEQRLSTQSLLADFAWLVRFLPV
jgi:hypothetical protein